MYIEDNYTHLDCCWALNSRYKYFSIRQCHQVLPNLIQIQAIAAVCAPIATQRLLLPKVHMTIDNEPHAI